MSVTWGTLHLRIAAVAAFLTICCFATVWAQSQEPDPDARVYGAIAYNSDSNRYGWSKNYSSQDQANDRALEECGRRCRVVMRFWGEYCGALARSPNGAWGTASGPTEEEARRIALRTCREYKGTSCSIQISACNTP